ncbi:MAG: peptidase S41, partial [Bacteroidales bacterium]|nr:peptidase S41 [Bacteroidales bacterium]
RGEMINADSIHFPDSLKTKTLVKQRTIYGGGGIMPDIFVPFDTTSITPLHRTLSGSGILNRFSLEHVDANRKALIKAYPDPETYVANFTVGDDLMETLLAYARKENITFTEADSLSDKTLLKKQLKAYMARDLWKSAEFYRVMWTENEALIKGLEYLNAPKQYALKFEQD